MIYFVDLGPDGFAISISVRLPAGEVVTITADELALSLGVRLPALDAGGDYGSTLRIRLVKRPEPT